MLHNANAESSVCDRSVASGATTPTIPGILDPSAIGMTVKLPLEEARQLAVSAFTHAGAKRRIAETVANALLLADLDGVSTHGLTKVSSYCKQLRCEKVDGRVRPKKHRTAKATATVDACYGFAYPALDMACKLLTKMAKKCGVAVVGIRNSHHAGVLGHTVEKLAQNGLVGLAFANSQAAIAPPNGSSPVYGTNPIALAYPRRDQPPVVTDVAMTISNRSRVLAARHRGDQIPEGCGLDAAGQPTTDPYAILDGGTLLPIGGAKGAALAATVEIMAAVLTGATLSAIASSFSGTEGGPPATGQIIIAFDPIRLGGAAAADNIELLVDLVTRQLGARVPGSRRYFHRARALELKEITVEQNLFEELKELAGEGGRLYG